MMMVMMAKNVSIMGSDGHRGHDVLVVMMVRVSLEPLGSAPQRRASAVAFLIALGIIIFGLSPLGTRSSFATCFDITVHLGRRVLQFLSPPQRAVRRGQMSTSRNRAGHAQATNATSNTREHTAEFTLDTRFSWWSLNLWLGTLHGLWERRDAASFVDLLDA